MTTTPQAVEHDALTGETIIRDLTPDELAQREADRAAADAEEQKKSADKAARKAARDSAIARFKNLGFTDAEIDTLVLPE